MTETESGMQRVSAIVQEIANASVEEFQGIGSINNPVVHLGEAVRLFTLPSQGWRIDGSPGCRSRADGRNG